MIRSALLAALSTLGLFAQDAVPKVSGLIQVWYTQALTSRLRHDAPLATQGHAYYDLASAYTEDGFVLRRAQLQIAGDVPQVDGLSYVAMADFALNTTGPNAANTNAPYNPALLQDLYLDYRLSSQVKVRIGQFKALQTYEGLLSPAHLLFAERSQLGRRFADRRDRGLALGWTFGGPGLGGTLSLGVFNGANDLAAGKANDANAQKDFVARLEFAAGGAHRFGLYTLQGSTDQRDSAQSPLVAKRFAGDEAPTSDRILADKDRTTNLGAFYAYDGRAWHVDGEVIAGRWGRRYPSVGAQGGPAGREALNQTYLSAYATAAYRIGAHTFALRYDLLDANWGRDWHTAYDPYAKRGSADATPRYTEITAGYAYALRPKTMKTAAVKLSLIHRSKNILAPGPGETGAQGGDSLVAAFQAGF